MYVVGLTGGIGSGKSTAGEHFKNLGIDVIDADIAAREVVKKGAPALSKIADYFGKKSLLEDDTLNRAYLRSTIFEDQEKRQWLETLLHPLIREWIQQALNNASSPYAILESPLLLETSQHQLTDRILVVDIPETLQISRASLRDNNNKHQIQAIIDTQLSRTDRLSRANDILDNSGPPQGLPDKIAKLHQAYLILATEKKLTGK
ncbi:MAG: dephospho-CoA kinase [Porticoccus sp.]|nr:dephospho-CoA kinase [Porticoccus sp.]